jgi:type II secretion system protein H
MMMNRNRLQSKLKRIPIPDEVLTRHDQSGFTLLELMVTMSIFAIICAIAVPNVVQYRTRAKLRGAAAALRANLEMAKGRAIRERSTVVVQFTAAGYSIFVDDGAGGGIENNQVRDGTELLIASQQLINGLQIDLAATDYANDRNQFDSRGRSQNGQVVIQNTRGDSSTITTNISGRVRIL